MAQQYQIDFVNRYAQMAMQQEIQYGIPASVTLAQMALESDWGRGYVARAGNNYFGIKQGSSTGPTIKGTDGLAYRQYQSPEDSIIDHSRVLMGKNYALCRQYSWTDAYNWCRGLKACNYASDSNYVNKLLNTIKSNGLQQFDTMAENIARQNGIPMAQGQSVSGLTNTPMYGLNDIQGRWCLPMDNMGSYRVTELYKQVDSLHPNGHTGLDISTNHANVPLYATEDTGRVIQAIHGSETAGNYVTVQYDRTDGSSYQITYMHMKELTVKQGDRVMAGQQLGLSGTTGRSTGEHLHMEFRYLDRNTGQYKRADPAQYLAELEVRSQGQLNDRLISKGQDLLAAYKNQMYINSQSMSQQDRLLAMTKYSNDPTKWLSMLSSDDGIDEDSGRDLISGLISKGVKAMFTVAIMLDAQSKMASQDDTATQSETEKKIADSKVDGNTEHIVRESVDGKQLASSASLSYDEQLPEQKSEQQTQGIRQV